MKKLFSTGENEGRPACRPTLEARKQIHAVMEQTFGVEKAAEIKGIFDQCARDHRGSAIHVHCPTQDIPSGSA